MKRIIALLLLTSAAWGGTFTINGGGAGTLTLSGGGTSAGVFTLGAPATTPTVSYSGFAHRFTLTISSTNVSPTNNTVLSNFPVLVSANQAVLSTTSASGGQLLNANGFDEIFSTMSDCSFNLHWDTKTIQNVGVSTFNAWVQLPSISTQTSTVFYLCFGSSTINSYLGKSSQTWDSNYLAVYHLGNGNTLNTVNSIDGTTGTNTSVTATAGNIDGAGNFNGSANINGGSAYITQNNNLTVSVWVNPQATSRGDLVTSWTDGTSNSQYDLLYGLTSGEAQFFVSGTGGAHGSGNSGLTMSDGTWYYLTGTYDGTTITVYTNAGNSSTSAPGIALHTTSANTVLGNNSNPDGPATALLSEARVSNTVRSIDWIGTEYNNQSSPSTFVTFSAEQ